MTLKIQSHAKISHMAGPMMKPTVSVLHLCAKISTRTSCVILAWSSIQSRSVSVFQKQSLRSSLRNHVTQATATAVTAVAAVVDGAVVAVDGDVVAAAEPILLTRWQQCHDIK